MDGICTESLTVVVRIFIFIILTRISVICKGDGNKSQINNEIFMKHHFSVFEVGKTLKQTEYIWYSAHVHLSAVYSTGRPCPFIQNISRYNLDKTHIIIIFSSFFFKNSLYPKIFLIFANTYLIQILSRFYLILSG